MTQSSLCWKPCSIITYLQKKKYTQKKITHKKILYIYVKKHNLVWLGASMALILVINYS